ncbi:hypothetical protein EPR50_G00071100 [Perca flavescens]|uniref:Uncharacterized protein n=1 Tax=Perca flavescens TaxID=8167 RepID=A0A484D482_PERFV|nr:hypothetical protein EPR50_G00071100 [Perca flavescens]
MNPNISVFWLSLFVLLHFVGAKSVSDLQSLKQLLEEEINAAPYYSSEEMEVEGRDGNTDKSHEDLQALLEPVQEGRAEELLRCPVREDRFLQRIGMLKMKAWMTRG